MVPADDRLDLLKLRVASRPDRYLQSLAATADAGATYVLGLVVSGVTIYGRTSTELPLAAALDEENEGAIRRARNASEDESGWGQAQETLRGAWARSAEQGAVAGEVLAQEGELAGGVAAQEDGDVDGEDLVEARAAEVARSAGRRATSPTTRGRPPGPAPGPRRPPPERRSRGGTGWA
jgi:hypothetical protein